MNDQDGASIGLQCARCGCRDFRVTHTEKRQGNRIYRRRVCRHCGRPAYTIEMTTSDLARQKRRYG